MGRPPSGGPETRVEGSTGRADQTVGTPDRLPPILVVEDSPEARAMFARLVQKLRVVNPVDFAEDGQAAIDYLSSVLTGERAAPVVVLLDLNMPRKSGLEVLRWLRTEAGLPGFPVVILTGSAEMEAVRECHDLGVASYLVKPVGFTALSDVLRGLDLRWALFPKS